MNMITARHLQKEFKTPVIREGRFSGLRTLFSREYVSTRKRYAISVLISAQGNLWVTSVRTGLESLPRSKC